MSGSQPCSPPSPVKSFFSFLFHPFVGKGSRLLFVWLATRANAGPNARDTHASPDPSEVGGGAGGLAMAWHGMAWMDEERPPHPDLTWMLPLHGRPARPAHLAHFGRPSTPRVSGLARRRPMNRIDLINGRDALTLFLVARVDLGCFPGPWARNQPAFPRSQPGAFTYQVPGLARGLSAWLMTAARPA